MHPPSAEDHPAAFNKNGQWVWQTDPFALLNHLHPSWDGASTCPLGGCPWFSRPCSPEEEPSETTGVLRPNTTGGMDLALPVDISCGGAVVGFQQ